MIKARAFLAIILSAAAAFGCVRRTDDGPILTAPTTVIGFALDSAVLTEVMEPIVSSAAADALAGAAICVEVAGPLDQTRSKVWRSAMWIRRNNTVVAALMARGVPALSIWTQGADVEGMLPLDLPGAPGLSRPVQIMIGGMHCPR